MTQSIRLLVIIFLVGSLVYLIRKQPRLLSKSMRAINRIAITVGGFIFMVYGVVSLEMAIYLLETNVDKLPEYVSRELNEIKADLRIVEISFYVILATVGFGSLIDFLANRKSAN